MFLIFYKLLGLVPGSVPCWYWGVVSRMEGVANTGLTSCMLIGVSGVRGPTPPMEEGQANCEWTELIQGEANHLWSSEGGRAKSQVWCSSEESIQCCQRNRRSTDNFNDSCQNSKSQLIVIYSRYQWNPRNMKYLKINNLFIYLSIMNFDWYLLPNRIQQKINYFCVN